MKKITFAIAMSFSLAVFAQNRDTSTWYQQLQFRTALLNNNQILTNRLYDKVPSIISPLKFKGQFVDTLNTLTHTDFKQLMWQHFMSAPVSDIAANFAYQQYDSLNWNYVKQGSIPLNLISYAYDIIKHNAFQDGLLTINNDSQLVHSSDSTPFEQFTMFATSLWFNTITENENSVSFVLPQNLILSNISTPIQSISFKAENADYINIQKETPFTVFFEDTGLKTCIVRVEYLSGVVMESGFSFYLAKKADIILPDLVPTAVATVPYNQICEGDPNYNPYGVARYYIKFANPDKKLRRPFIFVEGIDFDYRDYLNNPNNPNFPPAHRYGEFGWDVFANGGAYPQSVPDYSDGLPFSIGLNALAGQGGLIQKLLNEGYDIVLVDFAKGADYVQKNAFALVKVIQELNALKITKDENVIVGASMGGLVTRYALAYMETKKLKHCTRLWCSFDAPHLGANIPVGLQYALLFFANSDNMARENLRRINLPAAKQMLIRHISRDFNGINEVETFASCYRDNLTAALNEIGWPKQLRKIAIANGNVSSLGNGITNGTKLMEWSHKETFKFLGITYFSFDAAACNIFAQGRSDNTVFYGLITNPTPSVSIGGICFGTGGVHTFAIPNGPITLIAYAPGVGPCLTIQISRFGKSETWNCGGANCANLDGAPGGLHDGVNSLYNGIKNKTIKDKLTQPSPNHIGFVNFIPSISSLNVYNTSDYKFDIFSEIDYQIGDLTKSPFEAYKGPELLWPNEGHVFLTKNNQWGNGYNGNVEYIVDQLEINYGGTIFDIPNATGLSYNHGLRILGDLKSKNINSGGIYSINKQGLIGWGVSGNYSSQNGSILEVSTTNNCDYQTDFTVNAGGQFIVGDIGPTPINNKGIVTFTAGSKLILNNGSVFIINKGSKVIIDEGASITFNQGASILIADGGILEIRGKLFIGENAIFTYKELSGQGKGFIRIVSNESINEISYQINPSINSKISLSGFGSYRKVLEVTGTGTLHLQQHINHFSFECTNAIIELGNNNYIKSTNSILLDKVIIKKNDNTTNYAGGIVLGEDDNATNPVTPIIAINNCKFYNCNRGLAITRSTSPNLFTHTKNSFYSCNVGFYSNGTIVNMQNGYFTYCTTGWEIVNPINTSTATEMSSNNCDNGILYNSPNTSVLQINKYNSYNDYSTISATGGTLKVKCMSATNTFSSVIYANGTEIILNGTDGGFNYISNAFDYGLSLNSQSNISIKDGINYIGKSSSNTSNYAIAEFGGGNANLSCSQQIISPDPNGIYTEILDVSGNYIQNTFSSALYKRLCGTVYEHGGLYNNNTLSSTYVITQIDNTCNQGSAGAGGGGYGKKEISNPNNNDSEFEFDIFPNPAKDYFQINLNTSEFKSIKVFDSLGKLVYQTNTDQKSINVNTNNLNNGVYFVIISGNGTKRSKVLINK